MNKFAITGTFSEYLIIVLFHGRQPHYNSFRDKYQKSFHFRWVNSGYTESCLDLAEELANQTPVRLDVLLSLTPSAVTSDQLVVPGPIEETKSSDRVARSHSVGSIREMGSTEAERRILDMVAAGGEGKAYFELPNTNGMFVTGSLVLYQCLAFIFRN